jgi:3',5'-cyclic AMP phosphodiesterase CpdA
MRIAALYDIHGNEPALEAVLQEIVQERVDLVVIGGDVVWGPMPPETLGLLLDIDIPMHFVRGNADREVIAQMSGEDISAIPDEVRETTAWVAQRLEPQHRQLLPVADMPTPQDREALCLGPGRQGTHQRGLADAGLADQPQQTALALVDALATGL